MKVSDSCDSCNTIHELLLRSSYHSTINSAWRLGLRCCILLRLSQQLPSTACSRPSSFQISVSLDHLPTGVSTNFFPLQFPVFKYHLHLQLHHTTAPFYQQESNNGCLLHPILHISEVYGQRCVPTNVLNSAYLSMPRWRLQNLD